MLLFAEPCDYRRMIIKPRIPEINAALDERRRVYNPQHIRKTRPTITRSTLIVVNCMLTYAKKNKFIHQVMVSSQLASLKYRAVKLDICV